jgi:L-fucono-1,5-lactonase
MAERIDAHHHLWRYRKEKYGWIGAGMDAIARDFTATDLRVELEPRGISGSVVVQACHTLSETEWLLDVAAGNQLIRGVVGWAPIVDPAFPEILERLLGSKKLKGLRHVVQDEPDDEFILRSDFNAGIGELAGRGLVYDILIYERQLPATIKFLDRHPNQVFVLDHLAKPRIKQQVLDPWRANLFELAKRENVYCKLSGMATEADWNNWSAADLGPYADAALEAFGPARLMFGSDWPVCLLACSYPRWLETATDFLRELSGPEQNLVFGGVASKVYSLSAPEKASGSARRN